MAKQYAARRCRLSVQSPESGRWVCTCMVSVPHVLVSHGPTGSSHVDWYQPWLMNLTRHGRVKGKDTPHHQCLVASVGAVPTTSDVLLVHELTLPLTWQEVVAHQHAEQHKIVDDALRAVREALHAAGKLSVQVVP